MKLLEQISKFELLDRRDFETLDDPALHQLENWTLKLGGMINAEIVRRMEARRNPTHDFRPDSDKHRF